MRRVSRQKGEGKLVGLGIVLLLAFVAWQVYLGATIKSVGIPGIFTVDFGARPPAPPPPDNEVCSAKFRGDVVQAGNGEIFIGSGSSDAQRARVYVDGRCEARMLVRESGGAVYLVRQVPPGVYGITIRKHGFRDFTTNVTVVGGQRSTVNFDLQQQ